MQLLLQVYTTRIPTSSSFSCKTDNICGIIWNSNCLGAPQYSHSGTDSGVGSRAIHNGAPPRSYLKICSPLSPMRSLNCVNTLSLSLTAYFSISPSDKSFIVPVLPSRSSCRYLSNSSLSSTLFSVTSSASITTSNCANNFDDTLCDASPSHSPLCPSFQSTT